MGVLRYSGMVGKSTDEAGSRLGRPPDSDGEALEIKSQVDKIGVLRRICGHASTGTTDEVMGLKPWMDEKGFLWVMGKVQEDRADPESPRKVQEGNPAGKKQGGHRKLDCRSGLGKQDPTSWLLPQKTGT